MFYELQNGKVINVNQIVMIEPSTDGVNTIAFTVYLANNRTTTLSVEDGDKLIEYLAIERKINDPE